SRVGAGTFHDFHVAWTIEMRNALNERLLPPRYYAMAEQIAGPIGPDVLTLQSTETDGEEQATGANGPTALATAPPRVRFTAVAEQDAYLAKQKAVVIRHQSGDKVIALIEIVSPGNKSSRHELKAFVDKATMALRQGYHLLILDLHRPGRRDPSGIHGAIWQALGEPPYEPPADAPLTLVAYSAAQPKTAFIEPVAVGQVLPSMPLFLEPGAYVNVPLEETYQAAWRGMPKRWKRVLEAE
ncbi:MAG: DUF4058 family protein, partial [Pirellulales bacterium]